MSYWFISEAPQRTHSDDDAVYLPRTSLPDFSRALSQSHLREWVKHIRTDHAPEEIDDETNYYWLLYSLVHRDDFVIAVADNQTLRLGEVKGDYRCTITPDGPEHVWPVQWIATDVPYALLEPFRVPEGMRKVKEIPGEEARVKLRKYFPSWKMKGYLLFRWVSVMLLLVELVYFWPHK